MKFSLFSSHRLLPRFDRPQTWLSALALAIGLAAPAHAAERLTIRLGPVQQTVEVSDLARFAQTGEVPDSLNLFAPLLNADTQQALTSRLLVEPEVAEKLMDDLMQTSAGERILGTINLALPDSSPQTIKTAIANATQQREGLSVIGFLRGYPDQTLTIDARSAIVLASQMNLPYWHSQALGSLLQSELTVPDASFNAQFDPTQLGPEWVRQQTLTFHDYDRNRSIPVDLYWSRHTRGPLIVISHGFGADRRFLSYLGYHLASYGFSVAAIEHPGSNVTWLTQIATQTSYGTPSEILPANEFIDRPKDVSFLLDQLRRLNEYSLTFRGKFNTQQTTVIGHSLGGYTALALAGGQLDLAQLRQFCDVRQLVGLAPADWLQCAAVDLPTDQPVNLRDPRVVQAIALNPVIGHLFSAASLSKITVPVMMLSSTDDAITPAVSQQLLPFAQLRMKNKYLLAAIGGTHLSAGDPANLNQALTQSLFVRERRGEDTEVLRQMLRGTTLAFVEQMTPQARRYAPFLSSAYVQSFSSPSLQLRLSSSLPASLSNWLSAAVPIEQFVSTALLQQGRHRNAAECNTSVSCVFSRLPLVMFILPGGLPLVAGKFRLDRWQQRRDRRTRRL
ncbi:alpha/beta hydrolase [Microcoleus sp. FACHB-1515]|uniref:alpha/beta hydrolase n=1 Tax=Cyanophyceae TaxID=3028117 RepID=UPI0018EF7926|nr:alpha/beta hydrolase [Microcoleus sp. FACHB-1515]